MNIRTHLLGLTTAALAVGTLGLAGSPAQAAGGIDGGNISGSGDVPTSVDVAAFGSGDALAAWTRPVPGGTRVYAAVASDGVWGPAQQVTVAPVTEAHDVHAVANDAGDLAVVWNQTIGGEERVRGSRRLPNGTWDGSTPLSPAVGVDSVIGIDAGMDAAGRVHVAYEAVSGNEHSVKAAAWAKGATAVIDDFGTLTNLPSIDVNPAGDVLLSYHSDQDGEAIMVTRRNASVGWLGPKAVEWLPNVETASDAELADDGRGAVMVSAWQDAKLRTAVVRVGAGGAVGVPEVLSPADANTRHHDLAVSPNGTIQASWSAFEGNTTYVLRAAVARPDKDFAAPTKVDPDTASWQPQRGLVSDRGAQVVVHTEGERLTLLHRTNPVLFFQGYDAGVTDGAFAADMDGAGNAVAVGIVENGFNSYVEADFLDLVGPTAQVTAPGARVGSPSFDVAWHAADPLAGVKNTDLIVRSAPWNGGFGAEQVVGENLTGSSAPFAGTFGSSHCFTVQAVDKAGNLGHRSEERCTTVPLDDTALDGAKWKRIAKAGAFNQTATVTKRKGRKLVLAGVHARHLELIVAKARKGGKVKVTWNGTLLKRISLKGKGGQVTVPLADFGSVRTGTLKVKVVSKDGRKVSVDGLVVGK